MLVNERELVSQCRQGDRRAHESLYALTCERIYRLLLRMTGNAEDAFELAQETYLRVFDKIRQFDGKASVATWVYQIALNEGRQFLRSQKRQRARLAEVEAMRRQAGDRELSEPSLDMRDALDQLPEEERTLLVLRYFEELSYEEMAVMLDKPAGTVASGLNRARHRLRDLLAAEPAREG